MEYIQLSLTLEEYQESKENIKKELSEVAKGFVRTGWYLSRIERSEAYKMDGYKSIAEFAKAEYNMTPSGVSRLINVYNKYTLSGDTPQLLPQYEKFNFSQLQEMMQIPESDHELILPEAKKESIRELRRFNAENESNPNNLLSWKQEPESELEKVICEFFRTNIELTREIAGSVWWKDGNIKELAEMVNPSGNRSYRNGKVFLMMYENTIKITEFGFGKSEMNWEKFFDIARKTIDAASGGKEEVTDQESQTYIKKADTGMEPKKRVDDSEKKEIAPAQRNLPEEPKPENTDSEESEQEETPAAETEQTATEEDMSAAETEQTSAESELEQEERPAKESEPEQETTVMFMKRWDYMKKRGRYAVALELSVIAEEADYEKLKTASFWYDVLGELVDEEGNGADRQEEPMTGQISFDDLDQTHSH